MPLKVEYMKPFVQAACAVLEQVSGAARPGPLGLLGTTFPAASINVATRVGGSLRGDVVYSMSSRTAQKLAGLLIGAEAHGFGRLTGSGLARLGDMLAHETNRSLADLGLDCHVGSPTVFQGMNVEFSAAAPALAVSIETSAGQVDVNVAVKDGQ
jgi:CheY-specific phosphatase CheX